MSGINFTVSREEVRLIGKVLDRAETLAKKYARKLDRLSLAMDLTACCGNGCPLDLERLLAADDANFSHDVFGIERNLNRQSGKLNNFFTPRYALKRNQEALP